MRLSEKLEEVLGLANRDHVSIGNHFAMCNFLRQHGDELRQALRDSERLDSGRIILCHAPDEWGHDRTEFVGINLRAAIDAAMGRSEGSGDGG